MTVGEYSYDGDGKRIKKHVPATGELTVFIYDAAGKLIEEHSTIVQTGGNAKTVYTTNDHLGSPRINTDATGQVISRHDYHPYGDEVTRTGYGSDTIRKQFTGYERDGETDLDFAEARMYASSLGRFTSVDPVNVTNERLLDPQQLNLFAYVRNNPGKFVDPEGRDVYVAIGTKPVGTATIRVIGAEGEEPKTREVPVYKMVVWDDVSSEVTTHLVTRDGPVMDRKNPIVRDKGDARGILLRDPDRYNIINSAFEPKGAEGEYNLVPLAYPAGSGLEAFALRNKDGSDGLAAEASDSPDRKQKDVATDIMIHVGGEYTTQSGETRRTGSYGCFGVVGGNAGIKSFVADVVGRQALNKRENKGVGINLTLGKRTDYQKRWLPVVK